MSYRVEGSEGNNSLLLPIRLLIGVNVPSLVIFLGAIMIGSITLGRTVAGVSNDRQEIF